jgi:hypothetical protein
MLAVARGIILAWFVLAFLPEILLAVWWLIKASLVAMLFIAVLVFIFGGW